MAFLLIADLCDRWHYTRAGIHNLIKQPHFPKPIARVSRGRILIFTLEDITAYEQNKPWLFNEEQKNRRRRLFSLLQQAKEKPEERSNILQHAFGEEAKDWVTK